MAEAWAITACRPEGPAGCRRNSRNRCGMIGAVAAALLFGACTPKQQPAPPVNADPVMSQRKEKDRSFKQDRSSPIPSQDRAAFQGLAYFEVSEQYRFRLKLQRHAKPAPVRLATNTGEQRDALRYGFFEFTVDGQACRLQAYRTSDEGETPHLFIPFRDATSGKETYAAGRYLELPENTSGVYDLDFNLAFNPYCAYGGDYSCPFPPPENHLKVAIRAGEKNYPLAH